MQIIAFLITLTILVFIHELGHYALARWHGVRVDIFSIGFGPTLVKRQFAGTEWRISLVPLGGYVRMHGHYLPTDTDACSPTDMEALDNKTIWQRCQIVAAGPLANILFTIALFWIMIASQGVTRQGDFVRDGIGSVLPGTPAAQAGLLPEDIILTADDQAIISLAELASHIQQREGNPIVLELIRDGNSIEAVVTPALDVASNTFRIGITDSVIQVPVGIIEALYYAGERTLNFILLIINGIANLFVGKNLDQVGGPIQIANIADQALQQGWITFISFLAIFSINLALINLLPIPGLDGGHLLNYAITAIFGERIGKATTRYTLPIGIVFLVSLMILVIGVDVVRLFFSS